MTSTLQAELHDTAAHLSTIAPPDLLAVFAAEQQRLGRTDETAGRIAVGDVVTTATLPDVEGTRTTVPIAGRAAVIVFYRGAWCPYCNVALAAYQREVLPVAREHDLDFVAVSPQGPDGSLSIAEQNGLGFPVLTDTGGAWARSLGIAFDLSDDVKQAQLAFGNDFTAINAGGEWALPKPTVIVVDEQRVARFVDVHADYSGRTEPAAIIAAIRDLARA